MKMPYLRAGMLEIDWRELWDYESADLEVKEADREISFHDDLLTQRELALMGE